MPPQGVKLVKHSVYSSSLSADCKSEIDDMSGVFRAFPLEKLPCEKERPGAKRPVTECRTQKSGHSHFFDTQRRQIHAAVQTVEKNSLEGVGGPAGPLTVIVSAGFPGGAGRFRPCRKHSLREGTAGSVATSD